MTGFLPVSCVALGDVGLVSLLWLAIEPSGPHRPNSPLGEIRSSLS